MSNTYIELPDGLPAPNDDGAADHLPGARLPDIALRSTNETMISLVSQRGRIVVYCYPMTGAPDNPPPGGWDLIPGARGCTPQSCNFRDHHADLLALDAAVFGLSTQTTEYQQETVVRLRLPFPLLSDQDLEFTQALDLPVFDLERLPREVGPPRLLKRLTMIVTQGRIEKVFYPVFPPDRNANQVIDWLRAHPQ